MAKSLEEYDLFSVSSINRSIPPFVTVIVNNTPLKMEVDTGASFTIISRRTYAKTLSSATLEPSHIRFTGDSLPVFGQFTARDR